MELKIIAERRVTGAHTEYAVRCQRGHLISQKWHRYSDFLELHERNAAQLGLSAFSAPKLVFHTADALAKRRAKLQEFLTEVVHAVGDQALADIDDFFGITEVSTPREVQMTGTVTKRGSAFPYTWKTRHFVLSVDLIKQTHVIEYFENEAAQKPKGTVVVLCVRRYDVLLHGLVFDLQGGAQMFARTPSAAERGRWLAALGGPSESPLHVADAKDLTRPLFCSWADAHAPEPGERLFVSWAEPSWALARGHEDPATRRRKSAIVIQKTLRGWLARRQHRALALLNSRAKRVQRQWRAQKSHLNVMLLQIAARQMLERRRAFVEAKLEANQQQVIGAEQTKGKYQKALASEQNRRRKLSVGSVTTNAAVGLAVKVTKLVERQQTRHRYQQYEAVMQDLVKSPSMHPHGSLKRGVSSESVTTDGGASKLPDDLFAGLVAWHCASSHCDLDDGDEVGNWLDLSGHNCDAQARVGSKCPTYASCAIAGSPAIEFAPGQVLVASRSCKVQTVALVLQFRSLCDYMMLFSQVERYTALELDDSPGEPASFCDVDLALRIMSKGFRRGNYFQKGPGRGVGKDHALDHNDWYYHDSQKLWINGDRSRRDWDGFPDRPICIVAVRQHGAEGAGVDDDFLYQLSSKFIGTPDHDRGFDGWMGEVLVWDRELSDEEAQAATAYMCDKWHLNPESSSVPRFSSDGSIITHCGWLLVMTRSGTVKMRWVTVQAGRLWLFKDEASAEPLSQITLHECKVQRNLRTRMLTIVGRRRHVRLIAADLPESLTWAKVLTQAATFDSPDRAYLLHDFTTDTAASFPALFSDLVELVDAFVPVLCHDPSDEEAHLSASQMVEIKRNRSYFEVGGAQQEALCAFLLCVHTCCSSLDELASVLHARYDIDCAAEHADLPKAVWIKAIQEPCRRRIAWLLLRWAQIHPRDFLSALQLRLLWQRVAQDGYFAELGLRTRLRTVDSGSLPDLDEGSAHDMDGFNDLARFSMKERIQARRARDDATELVAAMAWLPLIDQRWTTRRYLGASLMRAAQRNSIAVRLRRESSLMSGQPEASTDATSSGSLGVTLNEIDVTMSGDGELAQEADAAAMQPVTRPHAQTQSEPSPRATPTENDGGWLSVPPAELAAQLTLADERLYQKISATHLLSYVWSKRFGMRLALDKLPLLEFTQWFNTVACLVASAVVTTAELQERARIFSYFVAVAKELQKLNNFNGLTAVLAGLSNSAVHRLTGSQQSMPSESRSDWDALSLLMAPNGANSEYRAALAQQQRCPPFIPYIGVHLTDLTFIGVGNEDCVDKQLNFGKRRKAHTAISSCLAGRVERYSLNESSRAKALIDTAERLSNEEMYEKSLQIEPRGKFK